MWFKTLDEKIKIVKDSAKKGQWSGNANLVYCNISLEDYNWKDAASYFLAEYVKDAVKART